MRATINLKEELAQKLNDLARKEEHTYTHTLTHIHTQNGAQTIQLECASPHQTVPDLTKRSINETLNR